jgi:hypothetical protein
MSVGGDLSFAAYPALDSIAGDDTLQRRCCGNTDKGKKLNCMSSV